MREDLFVGIFFGGDDLLTRSPFLNVVGEGIGLEISMEELFCWVGCICQNISKYLIHQDRDSLYP